MSKVICLVLIISLIIGSCIPEKNKVNLGAWELVSARRVVGDSIANQLPGNWSGSNIKVWSDNTFVFVGRYKSNKDTSFFDSYGGGTYKIDGTHYEENIQYHTYTRYVGNKVKMLLEMKGDTLVQTYPVDDNWQLDKSNHNIEKYLKRN